MLGVRFVVLVIVGVLRWSFELVLVLVCCVTVCGCVYINLSSILIQNV
jgi:hypothetical protein